MLAGPDGKATVRFKLPETGPESGGDFCLAVDAHGDGRLDSIRVPIASHLPLQMEWSLPESVTVGDRIEIPVTISSDAQGPAAVQLVLDHGKGIESVGPDRRKIEVQPRRPQTEWFVLRAVGGPGDCELTLHGTAAGRVDQRKVTLRIASPGFPRRQSWSGTIDGPQKLDVTLPDRWVGGSLTATLSTFPSPLADLQRARDGFGDCPDFCAPTRSGGTKMGLSPLRDTKTHTGPGSAGLRSPLPLVGWWCRI